MASADRIKEEIGWLKLVFGASAAMNVSLIAWIADNVTHASNLTMIVVSVATFLLSVAIIWCNVDAYRLLRVLEES